MEDVKKIQLGQKYSDKEGSAITDAAKKEHMKVATFIRKCVLDKINFKND